MLKNLLADLPTSLSEELMEDLVCADGVRIERIVSTGQCSAPDDWYDQDENEWVLLLAGAARLEIEWEGGQRRMVDLQSGDHCYLPAHRRHRVEWTNSEEVTVWLAVWWMPAGR
ncbi:cupin domain-containing protein [Cerasicoccus maritimus]|uniref:cupin domain-containing protein n=1 Tax=Cerasicoccus maritimus TaxID=490089 RepID=UPI002852A26D|nr:cupin domain-containing protein [Cerasicoccus maritimus]